MPELIKKFSMASLRATYYLKEEFSACSKISSALYWLWWIWFKSSKVYSGILTPFKVYELQAFILNDLFSSFISVPLKKKDKTHNHRLLKGFRFIYSLVFEWKTFDFKKCITAKITKPRVIVHNPTIKMKQES